MKARFSSTLTLALLMSAAAAAQLAEPLTLRCTRPESAKSEFIVLDNADPGALITRPVNKTGEHIAGLTVRDFVIERGRKKAEILSVKELTSVESTVMRVIIMVDNSQSMSPHLDMLRSTLADVMRKFSPAVRVSVLFFTEQSIENPAYEHNGKGLPVVRLPYTYDKNRAVEYANRMLVERLLTRRTYLYDGVYSAVQQIAADTGKVDRSFAIVFSDGADNASIVEPETALRTDKQGTVFFTIDYLTEANNFLIDLAFGSGGQHFQARRAEELRGIFEEIAEKIVAKGYEVRYKFKAGPSVTLRASTDKLVMEEDIVRETFPLLPYVFFDQGSSAIPPRYTALTSEAAARFDEAAVEGGAIDFYYTMLNVLGSRMSKRIAARITVNGYVNDHGPERRNSALAMDRARAVKSYLTSVWGIGEDRITVASGTLPPTPSTSREEDGRTENSRAEITSDDWEILKPVTFVRRTAGVTPASITLHPEADAPEGLDSWKLTVTQNGEVFDSRSGAQLERQMTWNWKNQRGEVPASSGDLGIVLEIRDAAGDEARAGAPAVRVSEVRRERKRNVTMEDGITREKISLILFPFDVFTPGAANEKIMQEYVFPRITPPALVRITGYTDAIGSNEYNLTLSRNRADEVRKILEDRMLGSLPSEDVTAEGVGEEQPIFENNLPEKRFYNRTVNLVIERKGE